MIEINLLEQKKQFKMPSVLGLDLTQLNLKMLGFAIVFAYIPEIFLIDYFDDQNKELDVVIEAKGKIITKYAKELRGSKEIQKKLKAFNQQVKKLKERSALVDKIFAQKTNPKRVLEKIARSVPEDLWFNTLIINEDKSVEIKGAANSYKSIGNFISLANDSAFFSSTLMMADSKTATEKIGVRETRVETFEIKGKVLTFDPETK